MLISYVSSLNVTYCSSSGEKYENEGCRETFISFSGLKRYSYTRMVYSRPFSKTVCSSKRLGSKASNPGMVSQTGGPQNFGSPSPLMFNLTLITSLVVIVFLSIWLEKVNWPTPPEKFLGLPCSGTSITSNSRELVNSF